MGAERRPGGVGAPAGIHGGGGLLLVGWLDSGDEEEAEGNGTRARRWSLSLSDSASREEGIEQGSPGSMPACVGGGGGEREGLRGRAARVRRVRWAGAGWLGPRGRLGCKAARSLSPSYFF